MSETYIEETTEAAITVASRLRIDRREFMQFCAATATTLGLSTGAEAAIAKAVEKAKRPSVIWLQSCRRMRPATGGLVVSSGANESSSKRHVRVCALGL